MCRSSSCPQAGTCSEGGRKRRTRSCRSRPMRPTGSSPARRTTPSSMATVGPRPKPSSTCSPLSAKTPRFTDVSGQVGAGTLGQMEHHGHVMDGGHQMPAAEHAGHDMSGGGHDRHAGHSVAMFRDKFWLSLGLTIPIVLLSHDISTWFGYALPAIPGLEY